MLVKICGKVIDCGVFIVNYGKPAVCGFGHSADGGIFLNRRVGIVRFGAYVVNIALKLFHFAGGGVDFIKNICENFACIGLFFAVFINI